ncbi:helix-turn-helix transcriptional regulator [uncultured Gilvimarinus sp.]|uniref:helix-turn-helix transcriptional regulator n=1 Tax=uncultured Gilvimarinus sp. TaxID=1689143 RepID=UPI0030DBE871
MSGHLLASFGNKVKALRLSKNLSQENLAALAELDRTYISSVERGKRNVSLLTCLNLPEP